MAERSVQRRKQAVEKTDRENEVKNLLKISLSVPRVLPQDFEGYALSFFFPSYIFPARDFEEGRGFLTCLYPVWLKAHPKSPLRLATTAVALCLLEAWLEVQPDQPLSQCRSQYVKGIAALRESLRNTKIVGDEVLMAALMLDFYEGVSSFCTGKPNKGPHIKGTTALIDYQRQLLPASKVFQEVLLGARNQLIGRALQSKERVPPNVSTWDIMAENIPKTAGFRHDELNIELANFQAHVEELNSDIASDESFVLSILEKATELDRRFGAWTNTIPEDWTPTRVSGSDRIPQSVQDAGLYQDHCDIYKSLPVANICNAHSCSQIRIQVIILACLKRLNPSRFTTAISAKASEFIQKLADSVCASVPYHLGDRNSLARIDDETVRYPTTGRFLIDRNHQAQAAAFGGWFLVQRLPELLSPGLPLRNGQRQWILGQMERIRRIYVIRPHYAS